jgi:hypothetical protein
MQQIYFTILLRKAIHLIVMELIAAHPQHGPEKPCNRCYIRLVVKSRSGGADEARSGERWCLTEESTADLIII